ncbi:hypothetical protein PMSD_18490 [Paenibacillus macquariensis subsp. defensor]|nr:hypothetical protein PMSD_18490 [Paenibacillus macquariensis subsp. defensor]
MDQIDKKRSELKKLNMEITFLQPLNDYFSPYYRWFDLNWKLSIRYSIYVKNLMGQIGANQEDIITVNENTTKYYLMILNYIKTNTILLRAYLDKTRKTANNQTHKFFDEYIEMLLRMTVDSQEKFISNTVTTSTICQTRNLMFFFNEISLMRY